MYKKQIMIDHASNDKRSTSAMLRGTGDGREQSWFYYLDANKSIDDMELLIAAFHHEARYGRTRPFKEISSTKINRYFLTVLAILFVVF